VTPQLPFGLPRPTLAREFAGSHTVMEFLKPHETLTPHPGVTVLVHKTFAHAEALAWLSRPERLWERPGLEITHDGKNRIGHGEIQIGFTRREVFVKEFLRKGAFDDFISVWRESRAAKAFLEGCEIEQRDIPTPTPLAAVTVRAGWGISRSWIITDWLGDLPTLRDVMDKPILHRDVLEFWPWETILKALGHLLRLMEEKRVSHRDLSLRNILIERPGATPPAEPHLWLIDLNRTLTLSAEQWDLADAAVNYKRLRLSDEDLDQVIAAHLAEDPDAERKAPAFRAARGRHVAYKRLKKVGRGGA
jgi:hypothetical protein